jgi:hypothetical protein
MMTSLVAALLFVLALGQIAAAIGVWNRHAIPRAPRLFRVITVVPTLASSTTATVIGWMLLSGADELFGMPAIAVAAIYAGTAALTWWSFVAYAVFHYFRTRSS